MFTLCIAKSGRERPSLFFQGKSLDHLDESEYEIFHLLNNKKIKKMGTEFPFCSWNAQKLQQQIYATDIDEVN